MSHHQSSRHQQTEAEQRAWYYRDESETQLMDYILQLWRGKLIIIAVMILAVLLAALYLMKVPEQWISRALVGVPGAGQVASYNAALSALYEQYPQDKLSISDLQKQLFDRFNASAFALSGSLKNLEHPLELKVEPLYKGQVDPLRISFSAENAKEAQRTLEKYILQIDDGVVSRYTFDIMHNLAVKKHELTQSLQNQIKVATERQHQRNEAIKQALIIAKAAKIEKSALTQAEYLSDDTLYLLGSKALQAMIINGSTRPLVLDNFYYETQRGLMAINKREIQLDNLHSYRSIMQPDLPIRRDSPHHSLIFLMAVTLGFIIGSSVVIAWHLLRKNLLHPGSV